MTTTPDLNGKKDREYSEFSKVALSINTSDGQTVFDMFEEYKKYDLKRFFTFISEGMRRNISRQEKLIRIIQNQLGNAYIAKVI